MRLVRLLSQSNPQRRALCFRALLLQASCGIRRGRQTHRRGFVGAGGGFHRQRLALFVARNVPPRDKGQPNSVVLRKIVGDGFHRSAGLGLFCFQRVEDIRQRNVI